MIWRSFTEEKKVNAKRCNVQSVQSYQNKIDNKNFSVVSRTGKTKIAMSIEENYDYFYFKINC